MTEASSTDSQEQEEFQEEFRQAWLSVLIDEILLECYEGLL
jgi:hypothetical protein